MAEPRKLRYTIWYLMVLVALSAGLLAIPRIVDSPDRLVFFCALGVLTGLFLIAVSLEYLVGKPCPACSRGALRRVARYPRYFRCSMCGARFKRTGFGPWLDASGPEDAARYRRRKESGKWRGYAAPEELDSSTSGQLLQSKRSRDLAGEMGSLPCQPESGRRLADAQKKARKFLRSLGNRKAGAEEEDTATPGD